MSKLFFIGDSITAGAWDERGGWANRLIGRVMEMTMATNFGDNAFYCLPYNLGVSGNTAEDVLKRFEAEIKARLDITNPRETVQIIFSIGINDSVYMAEEGRPRYMDQEFRENIQNLIKLSQSLSAQVSFVGLNPVDDNLLNPIPWAPDKAYACEHVQRFESIIGDACADRKISFLPLFDKWTSMPDWKDHLIDGVHPNSKGHDLLAQQIETFLLTDDFTKFHTSQS